MSPGRVLLASLLVAAGAVQQQALAQAAVGSPDSSRSFRLMVDIQVSPHYSSQASYRDGGYTVSLGFGVNISPSLQAGLNVYTGRETIPAGFAAPTNGWLPLGGATLEITVFPVTSGLARPYASFGYGLYTLNAENGYSGGGGHVEGGMQWDFSPYFSLRGGLQYQVIYYHDPSADAAMAVGFHPFTLRSAGASLRLSFYPTVLP